MSCWYSDPKSRRTRSRRVRWTRGRSKTIWRTCWISTYSRRNWNVIRAIRINCSYSRHKARRISIWMWASIGSNQPFRASRIRLKSCHRCYKIRGVRESNPMHHEPMVTSSRTSSRRATIWNRIILKGIPIKLWVRSYEIRSSRRASSRKLATKSSCIPRPSARCSRSRTSIVCRARKTSMLRMVMRLV